MSTANQKGDDAMETHDLLQLQSVDAEALDRVRLHRSFVAICNITQKKKKMQTKIERQRYGSSRWDDMPLELLLENVLPRIHITDLLRLRAVHPSLTHAISLLSQERLTRQPKLRMDLPWFYFMAQKTPVVYDPGLNKWHWISLPLQPYEKCTDWNEPICSAGSLMCWCYRGSDQCHLLLNQTFTGERALLDCGDCDSPLPDDRVNGSLHLERKDDTGDISLIFLHIRVRSPIIMRRYTLQHPLQRHQHKEGYLPLYSMKPHITVERSGLFCQQITVPPFYIPNNIYYHQGILAFLQDDFVRAHPKCLPDLLLFDWTNWSRVRMPQFSVSLKVMLKANYEIVQMDADLLLLVFKREPSLTVRRVFVYKYNFADQGSPWLLLSNKSWWPLILLPKIKSRNVGIQVAARAGLLILLIEETIYRCHLPSNTWEELPPCYNPATGAKVSIQRLACAIDPTLR